MSRIDILMATYNGERFLTEQIESILNQTFKDFNLIVRDDCSSDSTPQILLDYQQRDERVSVFFNERTYGVAKNFELLIRQSDADYCMFSDQDDVWFKDKIEITMQEMARTEAGAKVPCLVHSDAIVTDRDLNKMADLHIGKRGMRAGIREMLFTGVVQGATMMINRSLRNEAIPFPTGIHMHDLYLGLLSEVRGRRKFIETPLMLYRQHQGNVIGINTGDGNKKVLSFPNHISDVKEVYDRFSATMSQRMRWYFRRYFQIVDSNVPAYVRISSMWEAGFFSTKTRLVNSLRILWSKKFQVMKGSKKRN